MCPNINEQAVNSKGRTLPALPKQGQTQNRRPGCKARRHGARPNPTLHPPDPCVTLSHIMLILKKFLTLVLLPLLLVGCGTTAITNLTPSRLPRKDNGQYAFGVEWASRQQSLIKDSIKPYVIIGLDQYPME